MGSLLRTLRLGMRGKDVRAVRRACLRFVGEPASKLTTAGQETFGLGMRALVKRAQDQAVIDKSGVVGPYLFAALVRADAFDAYGKQLLDDYAASVKPKLVEPLQGFGSLHESLWPLYSVGRSLGLSDLGTYNPASRLPSGAPSDHSVYPAYAFDLGVDPDTGYQHPQGRKLFDLARADAAVEYVILGAKIWSRTGDLRTYRSGGHANHVHVSGRR